MRYFKVFAPYKRSINGSGEYSQIQYIAGRYDYDSPDSISCFWLNSTKPNFQPFLLHSNAKLTDYLSNERGAGFFIFKNNFINFLSDFNIQKEYSVYPVELTYHKDRSDLIQGQYSALVIWKSNEHYNSIDFEKSDFYIQTKIDKSTINFKDKNQLLNLIKVMKEKSESRFIIGYDNIVLKNDLKVDIFRLGIFGGLYVSEKLKDAIEEHGFTGMEFKLMEHIVKEEEC